MNFLNRIEIRGIVGHTSTNNHGGKKILNLSVVTEHASKTADGTPVVDMQWFTVTAWEGSCPALPDTIEKGDWVHLTGRLRTRRYVNAQGEDAVAVDIVASRIDKLQKDA